MRGRVEAQGEVYHTFHVDDLIPSNHPLRSIKERADGILRNMSRRFSAAYGKVGRPGIPPERLIKALLLQALYSIRSEIQLCEQIGYNLLFRWFLDMNPSERVWTPEVFSMNRERFDKHGFVRDFFDRVVNEGLVDGLASEDHFSVDGSLIQSFASMKSLRPIDTKDAKVSDGSDDDDPGNPTVNFRNERRSNKTHRSIVDPQARLMRKGKGKPAVLSHSLHVLMENRSGLCMDISVDEANGTAERLQAAQHEPLGGLGQSSQPVRSEGEPKHIAVRKVLGSGHPQAHPGGGRNQAPILWPKLIPQLTLGFVVVFLLLPLVLEPRTDHTHSG